MVGVQLQHHQRGLQEDDGIYLQWKSLTGIYDTYRTGRSPLHPLTIVRRLPRTHEPQEVSYDDDLCCEDLGLVGMLVDR
jgi:hypothetical protein